MGLAEDLREAASSGEAPDSETLRRMADMAAGVELWARAARQIEAHHIDIEWTAKFMCLARLPHDEGGGQMAAPSLLDATAGALSVPGGDGINRADRTRMLEGGFDVAMKELRIARGLVEKMLPMVGVAISLVEESGHGTLGSEWCFDAAEWRKDAIHYLSGAWVEDVVDDD